MSPTDRTELHGNEETRLRISFPAELVNRFGTVPASLPEWTDRLMATGVAAPAPTVRSISIDSALRAPSPPDEVRSRSPERGRRLVLRHEFDAFIAPILMEPTLCCRRIEPVPVSLVGGEAKAKAFMLESPVSMEVGRQLFPVVEKCLDRLSHEQAVTRPKQAMAAESVPDGSAPRRDGIAPVRAITPSVRKACRTKVAQAESPPERGYARAAARAHDGMANAGRHRLFAPDRDRRAALFVQTCT